MNRKNRHRIFERLICKILIPTVIMSCMSGLTGNVFAQEISMDEPEETIAYLVNDDGTQTEISQEELEALREESFSELPEQIEVVLSDDMIFDDGETGVLEEDGIIGIEDYEIPDLETDEIPEEDGKDVIVLEAADADLDAETAETQTGEDAGITVTDGEELEHLCTSAWMEMLNVTSDEPASDPEGLFAADSGFYRHAGNIPPECYQGLSITQNGSSVTVKGTIASPWTLRYLFVDNLSYNLSGQSVNKIVNLDGTGYHTVALGVVNESESLADIVGKRYLAVNTITQSPGYQGVFEVYSSYFNYYPYDMAGNNAAADLYMEYSSDGGRTWMRSGYMKRNSIKLYIQQGYSISGLKAKTQYMTRIRYGTYVTYSTDYDGDGNSYFFGGPVLNTLTIKTGASSKPKVKSVTAKAVKVKYRKVRHYGYYTGVYLYTEKFYTCKIKVTVKLKKKPGTKGLFINGAWVKGNKKTYTKTFTPYPNYYAKHPRHYKYSVTVCSGQDKNWGGYSPTWSKNKKIS